MQLEDIKFSRRDKKRRKHELQEREKNQFRQFVEKNHPKEKYKRPAKSSYKTLEDWLNESNDE